MIIGGVMMMSMLVMLMMGLTILGIIKKKGALVYFTLLFWVPVVALIGVILFQDAAHNRGKMRQLREEVQRVDLQGAFPDVDFTLLGAQVSEELKAQLTPVENIDSRRRYDGYVLVLSSNGQVVKQITDVKVPWDGIEGLFDLFDHNYVITIFDGEQQLDALTYMDLSEEIIMKVVYPRGWPSRLIWIYFEKI